MTVRKSKNPPNTCSQCGKKYSIDEMIEFDKLRICYKCKPIFLQKIREGISIEPKTMVVKRSIWWKIYFFILAGLSLMGSVDMLSDEAAGIAEAISIPMIVIGTIGLYGYVFSKKIYLRTFWFYFFPVYLTTSIAYHFITKIDLSSGMTSHQYTIILIVSWIISLPGYIGVFLYALPSNKLWRNNA